jgi:hypothetical protein
MTPFHTTHMDYYSLGYEGVTRMSIHSPREWTDIWIVVGIRSYVPHRFSHFRLYAPEL